VALLVLRRGDRRDDQLEERLEIRCEGVRRRPGLPGAGVGVDDRELDLRLVGVEIEEELVDLVHDLGDARVGPVDLVDDEDHRQPRLERLAQHEARLRQRPFARVDEQEHAVDHGQPRSTSPPKSAWPGVSMMLIFVPPCRTAVFLARIVMPFSRSRSPVSMTRSLTS
jgi:hypothetical protein